MVKKGFAIIAPSSSVLLTEVMAMRKATFRERRERGQEASGSLGDLSKEVRMKLRSHWGVIG